MPGSDGPPHIRLSHEGESIYWIYADGERVGTVMSTFSGWTATLVPDRRWSWTAPSRREALGGLVGHLSGVGAATLDETDLTPAQVRAAWERAEPTKETAP